MFGEGFENCLPNPPDSIGNEFHSLLGVELSHGFQKSLVSDRNELGEVEAVTLVLLYVRDDEPEVRRDQPFRSLFISCLRATRESTLFFSVGNQRSFWMSWRYWSNAVEGDERKKPLDLLSVEVCIHAPVGLLAQAHLGSLHLYGAHNSGVVCLKSTATFHAKTICDTSAILTW